jgi:hypothetical protein
VQRSSGQLSAVSYQSSAFSKKRPRKGTASAVPTSFLKSQLFIQSEAKNLLCGAAHEPWWEFLATPVALS